MLTWPCYIINLSTAHKRLERASKQLECLGIAFRRFDAVCGEHLSEVFIQKVYAASANHQKARKPLTAAEIGCYLSHYKLWQHIANSDSAGAFVFEDDFKAGPVLSETLAALEKDDGDWDMVKLFNGYKRVRSVKHSWIGNNLAVAIPRQIPNSTVAYAIRRRGAEVLSKTMLPISRQVDEQLKFLWEHQIRIAVILPEAVTDKTEYQTPGISDAHKHYLSPTRSPLCQSWHNLKYHCALRWKHIVTTTKLKQVLLHHHAGPSLPR